ncbi:hypothetical protein PC116_g29369 [Phytophthora cactorum]|nr:hypothetical protein PC116_g29369 [Phytophthora cactorum]
MEEEKGREGQEETASSAGGSTRGGLGANTNLRELKPPNLPQIEVSATTTPLDSNAPNSSSEKSVTDGQISEILQPPQLGSVTQAYTSRQGDNLQITQPRQADAKKSKSKKRNKKGQANNADNKSDLGTLDQETSQNKALDGCPLPNTQGDKKDYQSILAGLAAAVMERLRLMRENEKSLQEGGEMDAQDLPEAGDAVSLLNKGDTKITTIGQENEENIHDSMPKDPNEDETQPDAVTNEHVESVVTDSVPNHQRSLSQATSLNEVILTPETGLSDNGDVSPSEIGRFESDMQELEQSSKLDLSIETKVIPPNNRNKKSVSPKTPTKEEQEAIAAEAIRKKEKNARKKEREKKRAQKQWENRKRAEQAKQALKEARRKEQEKSEQKRLGNPKDTQALKLNTSEDKPEIGESSSERLGDETQVVKQVEDDGVRAGKV